jgi:hypothetical protein
MNDTMVFVEVDQVQGEEQTERMNPLRGNNPKALVRPQLNSSNQSPEARKDRIGRLDIKADEAFARLVIDTVCPAFHSSPDLGSGQPAGRSLPYSLETGTSLEIIQSLRFGDVQDADARTLTQFPIPFTWVI